jgi:hydroxymethylglutaryl-CoA lyase
MRKVKIIESPRDAMQGLTRFIPTEDKARYINALLKVGFDVIDFGSFVSPKAIPQLRDTAEVLSKLDLSVSDTKLLAVVANTRGGQDAARFDEISYIGFPFSISPTFLKRNINSNIENSVKIVEDLLDICDKHNKTPVIYISMAFGNPYGDEWNPDLVAAWVGKLYGMGVRIIPLSDTVGISSKKNIALLYSTLVPEFPEIEFGFHLHTTIRHWYRKINAAFVNGCRSFDTVINGLGGCPMAENRLVGNLRTSNLLEYLEINFIPVRIDEEAFEKAYGLALEIFP